MVNGVFNNINVSNILRLQDVNGSGISSGFYYENQKGIVNASTLYSSFPIHFTPYTNNKSISTGSLLWCNDDNDMIISKSNGDTINLTSQNIISGASRIDNNIHNVSHTIESGTQIGRGSLQYKIDMNTTGGDKQLQYDYINKTLLVNTISNNDNTLPLGLSLQDNFNNTYNVLQFNHIQSDEWECNFGEIGKKSSINVNNAQIQNISILNFQKSDHVRISRWSDIDINGSNIFRSSVNTVLAQAPFNKDGNIIIQPQIGSDIIFCTSDDNAPSVNPYNNTFIIRNEELKFKPKGSTEPNFIHFDATGDEHKIRIKGGNEHVYTSDTKPLYGEWSIVHTKPSMDGLSGNNLEFRYSKPGSTTPDWVATIQQGTQSHAYTYVGRHMCKVNESIDLNEASGKLVVPTGKFFNMDTDITYEMGAQTGFNDPSPEVDFCNQDYDSKIFGVSEFLESPEQASSRTFYWGAFGTTIDGIIPRLVVASTGISNVYVTSDVNNTQVNRGDFLTSHNTGCAQLQYANGSKDQVKKNYTIGKALQDVVLMSGEKILIAICLNVS